MGKEVSTSKTGLGEGIKGCVEPQVSTDNYLHGRLLFLHRWVGCCMSAAEAGGALH